MFRRGCSLPAFLLLAASATAQAVAPGADIQGVLGARSHPQVAAAQWARWNEAVAALYAERNFVPLWFSGQAPSAAALALAEELRHAGQRGLNPVDYRAGTLPHAIDDRAALRASGEARASLDVALSIAALQFASDMHAGRVDPRELGFALDAPRPPLDVVAILGSLAAAPDAESTSAVFDSLEPGWRRVTLLKQALRKYRDLAAALPRPDISKPEHWGLSRGDRYAGAPRLRHLLVALGDLADNAPESTPADILDAGLVAALERFQRRHGLGASGALDEKTYRALTVPLERRARQIELALERFRWLPPKLGSPPIFVNIPQFKLFAFYTTEDREEAILTIDVIVGQAFARFSTPVFAADMTHVVFNPYWDVPYSILVRELLPAIRADHDWVRTRGYEVVWKEGVVTQEVDAETLTALASGEARLRQRPGTGNSLGRIKFILPNRHNVYLHDTPAVELFAETKRAFSHGCVRVADPAALAEYVLREDPGWSRERILEAMRETTPRRVDLNRPIRVFMVYATALVAEDGTEYFFEDLYGHDARLEAALKTRRGAG